MKHAIYMVVIGALSAACVWQATRERPPSPLPEVRFRIERDTIIPPPIVRRYPVTREVVRMDTVVLPVEIVTHPVASDSTETYKIAETIIRPGGLDTVWFGAKIYPQFGFAESHAQWNADHYKVMEVSVSQPAKRHPALEIAPGVCVGVDARGRFNVVGGVSVTVHLKSFFESLNPF